MADRKISQLGTVAAPARTDILTMLDPTTNKKGAAGDYLSLTEDADITFSDITVGDVSAAAHGFSPKGTKSVLQVVNTQTGAVNTGTGTIAMSDAIPQNTDGTEFMTLAITPKATANTLVIDVVINIANGTASRYQIAALFQDTTANALAATSQFSATAGEIVNLKFTYVMLAGTVSATTFKVRAGGHAAGTTTFNGHTSARKFGGVYASSITITEYAA